MALITLPVQKFKDMTKVNNHTDKQLVEPFIDLGQEEWRPIADLYWRYEVSNKGVVRSIERYMPRPVFGTLHIKPKVIASHISPRGYRMYSLKNDIAGVQHTRGIARILAEAFIPNPENKPEVNHIDGNPLNNDLSNLEWNTRLENMQHASRMKLFKKPRFGVHNNLSKLTDELVVEIIQSNQEGESYSQLAKRFSVSKGLIASVVKRRIWKHVEY